MSIMRGLVLVPVLWLALPVLAEAARPTASASASGVHVTLVDLDPGDGVAAAIANPLGGVSGYDTWYHNGTQPGLYGSHSASNGAGDWQSGGWRNEPGWSATYSVTLPAGWGYLRTEWDSSAIALSVTPHTEVRLTGVLDLFVDATDACDLFGCGTSASWASIAMMPFGGSPAPDQIVTLELGVDTPGPRSASASFELVFRNDSDSSSRITLRSNFGATTYGSVSSVPEPAAPVLFLAGGLGLWAARRRRQ